jgi:uncharacterized protein
MKASRYNRIFQASDGAWLAFNAWSTALAQLTPEDRPFIEALLADPDGVVCDTPHKREIREALVDGHFLIEDHEEELTAIKANILRDRFRTDQLMLTIAPTLNCNFRCDYCYEDHFKVNMSRTVQDALIAWVEERARATGSLHVIWYGGEPLLPGAYEVVERLSEAFLAACRERDMDYDAEVVTNGYFLDRAKMQRLLELGVTGVQVTVDGPKDMHDQRRILAGGQGTFDRVLRNLKQVADLADVQLRINVDKRNALRSLEVAELLQDEGLDSVKPYLAMVTASGAACGNIQELCYSTQEFAAMEVEVYREAAKRGLPLGRYPQKKTGAFCTADRVNAFVVAPNGLLFKCWHEVTLNPDKAIGHLLDGQQPYQKAIEDQWLNWDILEKSGCKSCGVLPLCHGGCPIEAMSLPEADHGACEQFKFHLEPVVELQYLYAVETSEDGPPQGAARACK